MNRISREILVAAITLAAMLLYADANANATPQRSGPSRTIRVMHDVPYYTGPDADPKFNVFDLYMPEGKKNVPMLLWIHGGGFRGGDKATGGGGGIGMDHIVNLCADMGIGVMSINYRLTPRVKHPAHIQDVARAFGYLYKNGSQYDVDRNSIFVGGLSAGAILSAMLAADTISRAAILRPDLIIIRS